MTGKLSSLPLHNNIVLNFNDNGKELKEILKEHIDHTLRIPMLSTARSLNLSNCVALVTYDILRQKKFPGLATFDMIHKYDI